MRSAGKQTAQDRATSAQVSPETECRSQVAAYCRSPGAVHCRLLAGEAVLALALGSSEAESPSPEPAATQRVGPLGNKT